MFTDADFANDKETYKSTSGMSIYCAGGLLDWSSKLQHINTTSTAEAELVSFSEALKRILWIGIILNNLNIRIPYPIQCFVDNKAVLAILNNPFQSSRLKHMMIKIFFIKQYLTDDLINIQYISTKENISDLFTKALSKGKFFFI